MECHFLNEMWFNHITSRSLSKNVLLDLQQVYMRKERQYRRLVAKQQQRNCCFNLSSKQQLKLYKYYTNLSIASRLLEKTNKLIAAK